MRGHVKSVFGAATRAMLSVEADKKPVIQKLLELYLSRSGILFKAHSPEIRDIGKDFKFGNIILLPSGEAPSLIHDPPLESAGTAVPPFNAPPTHAHGLNLEIAQSLPSYGGYNR